MSRDEQIGVFISQISGHDKEAEILHILAIFAAYKMTNEIADKYGLMEYSTPELIDNIPEWMRLSDCDGEDRIWNAVIDAVGLDKIWHIIDNPELYIIKYNEAKHLADHIKDKLYSEFVLSS